MNSYYKNFFKSFFISLGAIAEILAIAQLLNINVSVGFLVILFLIPIVIYFLDFTRSIHRKKQNKLFVTVILFLLILTTSVMLFLFGNFLSILIVLLIIISGVLYDPYLKNITKHIVGFKSMYVALCWNMIVWVLFAFFGIKLNLLMIYILFFVFLRDLINISYCDLKDIVDDQKHELKTYVNKLGINNFFVACHFFNAVSLVILIIGAKFYHLFSLTSLIPVPVIFSLFLIWSQKNKKYYSVAADSEYFLWLLFVIIFMKVVYGTS